MTVRAAHVVERYLTHLNLHELEAAMACLSEAFQLEFAGSDFKMSKANTFQALQWDAGTNGELVWSVEGATEREVRVVGHETNEFLQLIGIGKLPFRSRFEVNDGGIVHQVHEVDWGDKSIDEALQPVVDWAAIHEPEELAAVYPDGRLQYTRESGKRWVALLRRWQATTE